MTHAHKAPSAISLTVWRLIREQQFAVPDVATLLALAPNRVARIVDAMHKRRIDCWRAH
jgi:hypothetical protein